MADKSKIEWTDATWNPIRGCSIVSEGCRNCYAMQVAARFSGKGQAYEGLAYRNESGAHWTGKVKLIEELLETPLRWKRPRRIFVNSMSDLFHESIPDEWIDRVFAVMALAPQHIFQVLTKRPYRMRAYLLKKELEWTDWGVSEHAEDVDFKFLYHNGELKQHLRDSGWWIDYDYSEEGKKDGSRPYYGGKIPLPNVWLGVSCEDQKTADERIPLLLQTPAAVRWISAEPLLEPISLCDLTSQTGNDPIDAIGHPDAAFDLHVKPEALNWVVVGGESGAGARPMHPDWARSLRDQCLAAGVPFFFKQWGKYLPLGVVNDGDELVPGTAVFNQHGDRLSPDCCGNDYDVEDGDAAIRFGPVGKKIAGRLLDGREWNEYPDIALGGA